MHAEVANHPLFTGSMPVGIMSGEKPRYPSAGDHDALLQELQQMGVQHEDTTGRYGEPERSVMIYGLPRERMVALGKKYGQESVVHSAGGRHHLIYTNGPNAGSHHEDVPGRHEYFPAGAPEPADNNTKLPGGGYFRLAFDFDRLHPPPASAREGQVPRGAAAAPVAKHERKSLNLNLHVQERSAVADDKDPRDPRKALHGLYKTLREEVEAYEAQCVALRKAETARLEKAAPPGFSEDTMHELKSKHGTESAFKIAWAAYDKKHGKKPIKKSSAPDGGMGDGGAAGFAMSEDDARAESYAKGELTKAHTKTDDRGIAPAPTPAPPAPDPGPGLPKMLPGELAKDELCKACGLAKGPKHDCDEAESYAKGEKKDRAKEDAEWEGMKVQAQLDSKKKAQQPESPYRKDELVSAKDQPRAPKYDSGTQLAAGAAPTTPGPKPGVTPTTKAPEIKLPQTREGGNGVTIKKAALPGAAPTAPSAPKIPSVKAPKLPGTGKVAAPKTPPMGAGTPAPNVKAELGSPRDPGSGGDAMAKVSLSPADMASRKKFGERTQQEQAVKLPGVRASVGNLMDNMLAGGPKPLNPGQPLSITPIASAPGVPVGPRPSPTGGQAPAPQPAAAVPMVQRVAASLTPPPQTARGSLPGAHLFAPKPAHKSEDAIEKNDFGMSYCKTCGKAHEGSKTVLGHGKSKEALAADTDASDREYIAQRQAREKAKSKK